MRYFLHLAYQGKNYKGWQRQTNAIGIQQVIEDCLTKVLKEKVYIQGCGRTDAGVHAIQYFAHIDIKRSLDFDFIHRINLVLPHDISIYDLIPVEEDHHAQYDVNYRTYTYLLHTKKIPQIADTSAFYYVDSLNMDHINKAIQILEITDDFRSLCKNPDLYKHTICKIKSIQFQNYAAHQYCLVLTADRFLRGMIRYIVARLIDIGTGKLSIEEFGTTLSEKREFGYRYHKKGHPQGLYLTKIEYPYLEREIIYPFDFALR